MERVGAVDQIAARRDALDRSAAGDADHVDPIAARELSRAAFLQTFDRFAVRQQHLEVPAMRGDDDALLPCAAGFAQAYRRSAFAAQITSLMVTPPAECVEYATAQRL